MKVGRTKEIAVELVRIDFMCVCVLIFIDV